MICYLVKKKGRRLWRGRYRVDGQEKTIEVSLGTKDKRTAQRKLQEIFDEKQMEAVGIMPPRKLREAAKSDLKKHLDDFVRDLDALGRDSMYVYNIEKLVTRLINECGWKHLADVTPETFQRWRWNQGLAPKTLNEYLASINALLNWLVRNHGLLANPLVAVKQVEVRGRERRKRRASTEDQLRRLLSVSGPRRPVYLLALHTGLRRAEIEGVIWGDVLLDVPKPYVLVRASTTKNHLDAKIWLHGDLVQVLREIRPEDPALDERVFPRVPSMYMFKKDLAAAGIPYKDALGRQADFHSLRHTFGTNLSKAGVLPRVAMELMRHSDLRLTMKVYTDATQLPAAEGIEMLPSLIKSGPHRGPHDLVTDCHDVTLDGTTRPKAGTPKGPDAERVCHDLTQPDTKRRK